MIDLILKSSGSGYKYCSDWFPSLRTSDREPFYGTRTGHKMLRAFSRCSVLLDRSDPRPFIRSVVTFYLSDRRTACGRSGNSVQPTLLADDQRVVLEVVVNRVGVLLHVDQTLPEDLGGGVVA